MFINFFAFFLFYTFLLNRVALLNLNFFAPWIENSWWLNFLTGGLSDFGFYIISFLIFSLINIRSSKTKVNYFARILTVIFCSLLWLFYASNLRYADHFGMMIRPFHFRLLNGDNSINVAMDFFFTSNSVQNYAGSVLAFSLVSSYFTRNLNWDLRLQFSREKIFKSVLIILAGMASHSANLNVANVLKVHSELRYNPILSLNKNIKMNRYANSLKPPASTEFAAVRDLFIGLDRKWAQEPTLNQSLDQNLEFYPIFQTGLPNVPSKSEHGKFFEELQEFVKKRPLRRALGTSS